jgi:serine/threonine protein kinase/tetratricopeptide (TPR) repeat protein
MNRPCPQCGNNCDETHKFCPLCGFPISQITGMSPAEDPFINRTLPGGYVILDLVGIGGMGRVYRAEQRALGRTVAVKVIHPHLLGDESAAARFITEARAASRLNHPHSVGVIDFGKTDDGQLYLVMEFLRGRDLARVAYEDGPLPIRRILDVLRQALAALAEAHHIGIVHRDLKPENIILEPLRSGGDFVKVVDFGLAKMVEGPRQPAITTPGIICGTPDYMAPEQGRGAVIDARTDLYAVGVILFQLLTGRLPFEADTPTQVVLMHLSIPPPDPRQVAPERNIPESLAKIVAKSLNKEPEDRWSTADEMSEAFASVQGEIEIKSRSASMLPQMNCPSCNEAVPRGQKFCGECGARVSVPPQSRPPASSRADRAAVQVAPRLPLPLTHREEDIAFLEHYRSELRSSLSAVRIVGEAGVGKTRLLREFLARARSAGDRVVETGPDPWWAEVAYYAARRAIAALAELAPNGGDERDWSGASAEARRGLIEVFGRVDALAATLLPSERRYTAAEALRWALTRAAARVGKASVILAIDDLNRVDGASRNAFADALSEPPLVPVLIVAAHAPAFDPGWGEGAVRPIAGLPASKAAELVRSYGVSGERLSLLPGDHAPNSPPVLPLYLDQLVRFTIEGGSDPPARLADLVALRIERLEPGTRRVLQALSVLGDDVQPADIENLFAADKVARRTSTANTATVETSCAALATTQIIERTADGMRHTHPLVREIVSAAIPAAVRRELHAAAAINAENHKLPIEVRALHTLYAQDAFEALLLLEQVAERALARGDASGAVLWLHRGLELARREMVRGELDDPMRAILIFSRKLGEALATAGDLTDANGVLREALDVAGPSGQDRAKVLRALANVAHERDRSGEALSYLSEALEHASKSGAQELVASLEDMRRAWAS